MLNLKIRIENMFRDYHNYEVFEDGRIWSKKRKKFLKPATLPNGYQQVSLYDNNGKHHSQLVHRVCWIAVNGREVPEGMQIHHRNEDKTMNAIWNLDLVSAKENCNFGTRNERIAKAQSKAMKGNTNRPKKRVAAYNADGELVMVFDSIAEAGRNGYHQGNVCSCCRNCFNREGNNVYKGFTWKYLDN